MTASTNETQMLSDDPRTIAAAGASEPARRTAGIGLAVFMAAAVASLAWGEAVERVELLPPGITVPRVLDGTVSGQISERLARLPLPGEAARLQRGLGWLALGDLGPQVRRGCPGWLFLRSELQVHRDGEAHARARAQTVAQVRQALAARGIGLLVAVVPDKTRIEAEHLCGLERPAALASRVAGWTALLAAQGVPVVDLAPALRAVRPDAFLRTDTHWNETGAGAAARAVAERIRAAGTALEPPARYEVKPRPPGLRPGDLVRLAGLDWLPLAWQPEPEVVQEHDYVAQAAAAESADDLFGDAKLPAIAVIGTSYTRTSNFVPQLAQELGAAVGNFGRDGGEFGGGARAYFSSPAYRQTPPRLIVWEIPERDLQSPITENDTVQP